MLTTSADTVLAKPAMIRSRSHLQTQKPLPPFLRRVEGSDGIRLLSADVTCSKTVENQHLFPCSVASKVNSFSANPPCPSFFSPRSLSPPSPSASLPADSASFSPSPTPPIPHPNPFPTRQRSRAAAAAAGVAPLWVCPGLSEGGPRSPGSEGYPHAPGLLRVAAADETAARAHGPAKEGSQVPCHTRQLRSALRRRARWHRSLASVSRSLWPAREASCGGGPAWLAAVHPGFPAGFQSIRTRPPRTPPVIGALCSQSGPGPGHAGRRLGGREERWLLKSRDSGQTDTLALLP